MKWADNPIPSTLNCNEALTAWNLFIDLCVSLPSQCCALKTDIDSALALGQTLFFGSNLPAITPEGECFVPQWDAGDKRTIRSVLSMGAATFRDVIKRV